MRFGVIARGVGGTVVDNDDLESSVALFMDRPDRLLEKGAAVIGGDDDTGFGHLQGALVISVCGGIGSRDVQFTTGDGSIQAILTCRQREFQRRVRNSTGTAFVLRSNTKIVSAEE